MLSSLSAKNSITIDNEIKFLKLYRLSAVGDKTSANYLFLIDNKGIIQWNLIP